jgi:hypothetical protein
MAWRRARVGAAQPTGNCAIVHKVDFGGERTRRLGCRAKPDRQGRVGVAHATRICAIVHNQPRGRPGGRSAALQDHSNRRIAAKPGGRPRPASEGDGRPAPGISLAGQATTSRDGAKPPFPRAPTPQPKNSVQTSPYAG